MVYTKALGQARHFSDVNMLHIAKSLTHYGFPQVTFLEQDPTLARSIKAPPHVAEFSYSGKTVNLSEYGLENCAPAPPGSGNVQYFDFAVVHANLHL
jgi:hypothetical protein